MQTQAHPQIKQIVGANIRLARTAKKLSRRALSLLIDADQNLIYKWERGLHRPTDEHLAAVAHATGREIAWFYSEHKPSKRAA